MIKVLFFGPVAERAATASLEIETVPGLTLGELREDLLHVDTVVIVNSDDWDGPPTRIASVIDEEVGLVDRGKEDRAPSVLCFNASVRAANLVAIVGEEPLQPSNVAAEGRVQFTDLDDPMTDRTKNAVLVRAVQVMVQL